MWLPSEKCCPILARLLKLLVHQTFNLIKSTRLSSLLVPGTKVNVFKENTFNRKIQSDFLSSIRIDLVCAQNRNERITFKTLLHLSTCQTRFHSVDEYCSSKSQITLCRRALNQSFSRNKK